MQDADWDLRDEILKAFSRVVDTYHEIRDQDLKVRSVLVLTMSDDRKSALRALYRRWIKPCIDQRPSEKFLSDLAGRSGLPRYLASAREVSQYLYREYGRISSSSLVRDLGELNFGYGKPWIVPVSAVQGDRLAVSMAAREKDRQYIYRGPEPIPAHVELPLLAALSEHYNALM